MDMANKIYKIDGGIIKLDHESEGKIANFDCIFINQPCPTSQDIIENCQDADALIVCGESITHEVLKSLPRLKVVARCGVGVDKVDLDAASQLGIQVINVPDANHHEVATHTMAMALMMNRRIIPFDNSVRKGEWTSVVGARPLRRPSAQEFGVIGGGRIGMRVAQMAMSVGFNVLVHTPEVADQALVRKVGASVVSFDELIERSDILTLHVPLLESTRNIISDAVMRRMKFGAYLINVSRGGLVDENALIRHLDSGHIAGAALDVFVTEPLPGISELARHAGLILTPHVAYLSDDSNQEVSRKAVDGVLAVLRGDRPLYPVNRVPAVRNGKVN